MTFNYPTLTIGPTGLGVLGTTPMITDTWSVAASSVITGGATVFAPLTINIYNECYSTAISLSQATTTFSYKITDPQITYQIPSFTITTTTAIADNCVTFTLIDTATNAAPSFPFTYPSITFGPTTAGTISTSSKTYNLALTAAVNLNSGATETATITVTFHHECSSMTVTPTAGNTISYTLNNPTI